MLNPPHLPHLYLIATQELLEDGPYLKASALMIWTAAGVHGAVPNRQLVSIQDITISLTYAVPEVSISSPSALHFVFYPLSPKTAYLITYHSKENHRLTNPAIDCYSAMVAGPFCADDTWSLWNATESTMIESSTFCCLPGQVGMQDGVCVTPDLISSPDQIAEQVNIPSSPFS